MTSIAEEEEGKVEVNDAGNLEEESRRGGVVVGIEMGGGGMRNERLMGVV